jgi:hypothetical protein
MEDQMHRRLFLQRSAALSLTVATSARLAPQLFAHEATPTPAPGLAGLDLPEVVVTIDDAGFTLPDGTTAGRTLMTVRNTGTTDVHFFATRIPDDVSDAQIAAEMASESEADPPWFDMTTLPFLGTPDWPAVGGEARGVVDLLAGRWIFIDPLGGRNVAIMAVNEGTPVPSADPVADVTITMQEMSFSGLEAPLAAGPQVWQITNAGALEHELAIVSVPAGTTSAEIIGEIGDMLAGAASPEVFAPVGGQGISSKGVTSWQAWDLPAGTYAAVCMSPMPGEGFTPHAMEGMVQIFSVA